MKIEQIYTGCLAHAAYYIESNGEAAIFDPLREVQAYIDKATKDNARIKYIFETHFHADFVSGHLDLAQKTGAKIVYGPTAKPNFEAIVALDNQEFTVGNYIIKALHTPGHTLESTTYLLIDENGKQHGLITGDTLFIGDVGRPDLAQKLIPELTQEVLANHLYDSLRNKIMPLADDLIIYPNHGAGSACGKNMSKETTDTLGNQKKVNYALRANMTREEFISELITGLTTPPAYFPQNVLLNINGYESLDQILLKSKKGLSVSEFIETVENQQAIILDVRKESEFVKAYIPGSIFIGLHGQFAPWVGALIRDVKQPIVLVVNENEVEDAITRLSRVGFDNTLGYLKGGLESWIAAGKKTDSIKSISPQQFELDIKVNHFPIVDARRAGEYKNEHIENAKNIPLDYINELYSEVPTTNFYIHCAGGYRSVIMASILKARGIHNMINVEKGMSEIRNTNLPIVQASCSL